jgi:hypothetical protein
VADFAFFSNLLEIRKDPTKVGTLNAAEIDAI